MNELDDAAPVSGSFVQAQSDRLPDLNIYGYQVSAQLSTHGGGLPSAGGNGDRTTYLAQDLNGDRSVVIKQWYLPESDISSDYAHYLPEITRLQQLDHPNIPRYLNSFTTPTGFCVVREYQLGISLADIGTLPPSDIRLVADRVLAILNYLHQLIPIVIHQNIKPENIIVNTAPELMIYLVDFSIYPYNDVQPTTGTPGFMPPEQLLDLGITSSSDIYSLAISLICLLTGTPTSQAPSLMDEKYHLQFRHLIPADTDPKLMLWLESMVEPNPQQRLALMSSRESVPLAPPDLSPNLPLEHPQLNLAFNLPKPPKKLRWLRWIVAVGALLSLVLIGLQILAPGEEELSPAQIAKNQAIAKEAIFAASDRGKLLKENRCDGCNLNYQNFSKAELTGAIVPQSSLIGANFTGANLTLAIFRDTDLSGANLTKANLDRAALYGAKLIGTNLVGTNLTRAKLVYAKLTGSLLRGANLTNSDLRFAEFQQVDLTNTNLTGADLSNADLSYANLRQAILVGTKLDGAKLTGAKMPDGSTHP
ncbi:pentapeptide repeat-containing protein [Chamaesiphon sp.]|uniref:pentapeptide repeat-containing protein n=1 Tax=Chamaesiphon sp. TaxID=2814140 RepID=UPI00359401F5